MDLLCFSLFFNISILRYQAGAVSYRDVPFYIKRQLFQADLSLIDEVMVRSCLV